jgi:hypothetical protein
MPPLHGNVVMDELHREYEMPFAAFSNQRALDAPHRAVLDTNLLTCDEPHIRLGLLFQEASAYKFDFTIRQAEWLTAITDQLPNSRSPQDTGAFCLIDTNEEVRREQRQFQFDCVSVLPGTGGLVGGQEGLEMPRRGFLVLRRGDYGEPPASIVFKRRRLRRRYVCHQGPRDACVEERSPA